MKSKIILEEQIDRLDSIRSGLFRSLEQIDPGILASRPASEKWSILEILEHLVLAEEYGFRAAEQRCAESRSRSTIKILVVAAFLKFGIPVKVPAQSMAPCGGLDFADLQRKWEANSEWLRAFWSKLGEEELDNPFFFHPVAGPLTVADAVMLSRIHVESHSRQIKKILRRMDRGVPPQRNKD